MAALILRFAFAAMLFGACVQASAQAERASDLQIKAAYLYQFGGFVEWPPRSFADDQAPFVIGMIGADAMATELQQVVAMRTVQGRKVRVRTLRAGEPLSGLHMLFVGEEEAARLPQLVAAAKNAALLLVTESEGALSQGSMINFVVIGNKVRFDIGLPQASRSELRISSRLLGVARRVVQG